MKPWTLALLLLMGIFFLGSEAFAQRGPGFSGRPLGPGFNGRPVGPGFGGRPVGPGFDSTRGRPIGFQGVPRGPGFSPTLTNPIGFEGTPQGFTGSVRDFPDDHSFDRPDEPVRFRDFGSGF